MEEPKEKESGRFSRILALFLSGIYVLIILPIMGIFFSLYLDSLFNLPPIMTRPMNFLMGSLFLVTGFFFAIWSNFELYRSGKGSPVPLKVTQTVELVIKGPYEYSRNPMIFGYIFMWAGLSFLFNSIFLLLGFTVLITVVLIIIVKAWEEKNLRKRFGNTYLEYRKRVSFLIPLPPKKSKF